MNNIEEQITVILNKYDSWEGADTEGNKVSSAWMWQITPLLKELTSLLQAEKEQHLDEFGEWLRAEHPVDMEAGSPLEEWETYFEQFKKEKQEEDK